MKHALLAVTALVAAACGAAPVAPTSQPAQIEMEPVVIESHLGPGSAPVIEAFDAATLFEEARGAFDSQKFDEAERLYGKLLEHFPKTEMAIVALYNRGLALEHLKQHGQAAAHFRRYTQLATTLKDKRDGEFRWGHNLVLTGDHPTAIELYTRLLDAPDLGPADRAEAFLRRGTARMRMSQHGEAEKDLKEGLRHLDLAYDKLLQGNELAAETHFRRGEIYQHLCRDVALKLPIEKMKDDLADKVRFFRQSQNSFLDSLNVHHSYWATAAGLKLGELYEDFYTDILAAEVPADFSQEERKYYLVELRKKLQPLLEQSLTIYEKNITMSERIGADNEWVAETEKRLGRLRSLLEATERGEEPVLSARSDPAEAATQPASAPAATPEKPPVPVPDAAPLGDTVIQ